MDPKWECHLKVSSKAHHTTTTKVTMDTTMARVITDITMGNTWEKLMENTKIPKN